MSWYLAWKLKYVFEMISKMGLLKSFETKRKIIFEHTPCFFTKSILESWSVAGSVQLQHLGNVYGFMTVFCVKREFYFFHF